MKIKLDFVAFLDVKGVTPGEELELDEGTTVADLMDRLQISREHQQHVIPVIAGLSRQLDYVLEDGDDLTLVLKAAGG
ncbi:MAG: hypothetical protein QGH42_12230 [Kiritimatiellia bacterium]|jgi:sulfur carrier protein ThiS|nr:hypothetical protein [Kiritimatiellia bacterium]MDP6631756.1 hypothetical protein [Kiritimatiellia bacterium]MDP6810490.1 hypothetical protein [Kiritimatiellia bacterium]MDP7024992.1 hypothetical protein [Kiritimatiellia bacterium]